MMEREIARDCLRVLVQTGNPTSRSFRDRLLAAAEVDDDFRAEMDSHRRVREARERRQAEDMKIMGEWAARFVQALNDGKPHAA